MIDRTNEGIATKESKIQQYSLLIRVIGLLLLAIPIILFFTWNSTSLLLFLLLGGVIIFVAAYRLSR